MTRVTMTRCEASACKAFITVADHTDCNHPAGILHQPCMAWNPHLLYWWHVMITTVLCWSSLLSIPPSGSSLYHPMGGTHPKMTVCGNWLLWVGSLAHVWKKEAKKQHKYTMRRVNLLATKPTSGILSPICYSEVFELMRLEVSRMANPHYANHNQQCQLQEQDSWVSVNTWTIHLTTMHPPWSQLSEHCMECSQACGTQ